MLLNLSHVFEAPASPADAFAYLSDVERAAACIPGVEIVGQRADGTYDARILLQAGPIRVPFQGILEATSTADDRTITIVARGADASRQTRASAEVSLRISPTRSAVDDASEVEIAGQVEFRGALAGVAKVGGMAVARNLLERFGDRAQHALGTAA